MLKAVEKQHPRARFIEFTAQMRPAEHVSGPPEEILLENSFPFNGWCIVESATNRYNSHIVLDQVV